MFPLAEAAPNGTANFLEIVFYLVGGVTAFVVLVQKLKKPAATETIIGDQPLRVQTAAEFATRREHEELKREVKELRAENMREMRSMGSEMKGDFAGVHDRITELLRAFSEMRGEVRSEMKSRHPFKYPNVT